MGEKKLSYTPWENCKRFFYIYEHLKDWGILGFFFLDHHRCSTSTNTCTSLTFVYRSFCQDWVQILHIGLWSRLTPPKPESELKNLSAQCPKNSRFQSLRDYQKRTFWYFVAANKCWSIISVQISIFLKFDPTSLGPRRTIMVKTSILSASIVALWQLINSRRHVVNHIFKGI